MQTGDIIQFGTYTQEEDLSIIAPIDWRVLDIRDGKALLLCDKVIDYHKFNEEIDFVSWRTCTLRKWMNSVFIEKAFTAEEQARICETDTESSCTDRVFCLSLDEVETYLKDDVLAAPTEYGNTYGTYIRTPYTRWWLRTSGATQLLALIVGHDGIIFGLGVKLPSAGVRPAMWITLDA